MTEREEQGPTEEEIKDALEFVEQLGYAANDEAAVLVAAYRHEKAERERWEKAFQAETLARDGDIRRLSTEMSAQKTRIESLMGTLKNKQKKMLDNTHFAENLMKFLASDVDEQDNKIQSLEAENKKLKEELELAKSKLLVKIMDDRYDRDYSSAVFSAEKAEAALKEEMDRAEKTEGAAKMADAYSSNWCDKIEKVKAERDELREKVRVLREALEYMNSPEMDWENGAVGVGYRFRSVASKALDTIKDKGASNE